MKRGKAAPRSAKVNEEEIDHLGGAARALGFPSQQRTLLCASCFGAVRAAPCVRHS